MYIINIGKLLLSEVSYDKSCEDGADVQYIGLTLRLNQPLDCPLGARAFISKAGIAIPDRETLTEFTRQRVRPAGQRLCLPSSLQLTNCLSSEVVQTLARIAEFTNAPKLGISLVAADEIEMFLLVPAGTFMETIDFLDTLAASLSPLAPQQAA